MNEAILKLAKECGFVLVKDFLPSTKQSLEAFGKAMYNKAIEDAVQAAWTNYDQHGCDSITKAIRALEMK